MILTTKTQIKLSILFFLGLTCLIVIFVYRPLFLNLKNNSENLTKKAKDFFQVEKEIKSVESFKEITQEKATVFSFLDDSFLNFSAPVEFFEFLEGLVRQDNLLVDISPNVRAIGPKEGEEGEVVFKSIEFEVLSGGSFEDTLRFLKEIEHSPFLLETLEVSLDKITEKTTLSEEFSSLRAGEVLCRARFKVTAKEKDAISN